MVGCCGFFVIGFVTGCTVRIKPFEIAIHCSLVAQSATDRHMRADEWEARAIVNGNWIFHAPCLFVVTGSAIITLFATMHIYMAARATLGRKTFHWAAIVVAHQAGHHVVTALEHDARLLAVIK